MLGYRLGMSLIVWSLATVAFAGSDKPIANVKSLAGDWRAIGGASAAAIRIKPDGSYEGTAASGAKTAGKITAAAGKASFQSSTSVGPSRGPRRPARTSSRSCGRTDAARPGSSA